MYIHNVSSALFQQEASRSSAQSSASIKHRYANVALESACACALVHAHCHGSTLWLSTSSQPFKFNGARTKRRHPHEQMNSGYYESKSLLQLQHPDGADSRANACRPLFCYCSRLWPYEIKMATAMNNANVVWNSRTDLPY